MMTQEEKDEKYMRRCLQIAQGGQPAARPNPAVGAVIVAADGRIIGEGFTSAYGGPHAEVNAFASVKAQDEPLLSQSTIYVSLEPCSHWGHTPPCCDLIIRKGVKRCVCGCVDPFAKVQGRGIKRMREAGISVTVGVLEQECRASNRRFMTFNTRRRPYILLKWAETANHVIGLTTGGRQAPLRLSSPFTSMLVHRLRADYEAILVGRTTLLSDHPQLTVRHWSGSNPERLVLTSHPETVPEGFRAFADIDAVLAYLYDNQRQGLMVEGGAKTLQSFIDRGLWDEIRVETAPMTAVPGTPAPSLPADAELVKSVCYDGRVIAHYVHRAANSPAE